jgi:hypothetical protein
MKKRKIPTKLEIDVHRDTGGAIEYRTMMYGAVYPHFNQKPKSPNYKGKCTITINDQEIELELAMWKTDYGYSMNGTYINFVEPLSVLKQKRKYE